MPSVESVLSSRGVRPLIEEYTRDWVTNLVRQQIEEAREAIRDGSNAPSAEEIASSVSQRAGLLSTVSPRPLINATGVIIHTNLGRAPLSLEAMDAIVQASEGYSDLELDLVEGTRGSRQNHVRSLLCQLTGAEAALVTNNNASAVLLGLSALASGREVIVSRGEEVEIGGGFRIPEVLLQSGATLVEVGTTNRTYASDYETAITENTAALLKVHASNFRIGGFTHSASPSELVEIGNRYGIPLLHDIGSGCLMNTQGVWPLPRANSSGEHQGGCRTGVLFGR